MIILITTITIILYVTLIIFTVHNLSFILDNKIKIAYIAIGLVIMYVITLIIFNISSIGIEYENYEIKNKVKSMLLSVFVPVNGILIMPYLANILNKLYSNIIEQKNLNKRIVILIVIFIVMLIFECSYLKSTQEGIINLINNM